MNIELQHLTKCYPVYEKAPGFWRGLFHRQKKQKIALDDISLTIPSGSLLAILGPNGSGKTTLMKLLSGILVPTIGKIKIGTYTPFQRDRNFLKKISLVMGQKSQLWWDLPPVDSFQFFGSIYEVPEKQFKERLAELTNLLHIENLLYTPVRKLSLGERMRCELVAALLHHPDLLFLDEPTIGLDILSQHTIREFIKKYHHEKKATILLTSHNMEDIETICKHIVIVNHGHLVFEGSLEHFKQAHALEANIHLTLAYKQKLPAFFRKYQYKKHGDLVLTISVPYNELGSITTEILSKLKLHSFTIKEPSFDEVISKFFLNTTQT